jgi:hypothetical protein
MVRPARNSSADSANERRRFGRFATQLFVSTSRDSLPKRGRSRRAAECRLRIQDFSLGGVRVESSIPLKVNEHLTLRLPPITNRPSAALTGRVVHCRRLQDGYQVGIEFCQTRAEPTASPWYRISTLFSLAAEPAGRAKALASLNEA